MSDQRTNWNDFYKELELSYPPEALIRVLKGEYPRQKMPRPKPGQSILDIGFGDGRNFPLFDQLGLESYGVEISDEICTAVSRCLNKDLNSLRTGVSSMLPYTGCCMFDYVCSWNSCYYMSLGSGKFEDHITEMHGVLCKDGWLICSIPTPNCFIFNNCHHIGDGYVTINDDYFGIRNGETMRMFNNKWDVEGAFSSCFEDFSFSSIDIDQFGLNYSWWVFTAKKKTLA